MTPSSVDSYMGAPLQRVGGDLVDQSDAAPLLLQVHDDAPGVVIQSTFILHPTIHPKAVQDNNNFDRFKSLQQICAYGEIKFLLLSVLSGPKKC